MGQSFLVLIYILVIVLTCLFGVEAVIGKVRKAGNDALPGKTGTVVRALSPEGTVFVEGEYWTAVCDVPLDRGQVIRVIAVEGKRLRVGPAVPDVDQGD